MMKLMQQRWAFQMRVSLRYAVTVTEKLFCVKLEHALRKCETLLIKILFAGF